MASCLSLDSGNNLPPHHLLNSGHACTLHCSLADTHHCASSCSLFHICSWAEHMTANDFHDIVPLAAPIPLSLHRGVAVSSVRKLLFFTPHTSGQMAALLLWLLSLLAARAHTDSDSTCHESELQDPFLRDCSPAFRPRVCTYIQGHPAPGAESSLTTSKGVTDSSQFSVVYKLI